MVRYAIIPVAVFPLPGHNPATIRLDTLSLVRQLIVNADDFGLTPGVNRAIVELARSGCLTSATLMAAAPATEEAIQLAHQTPALGVGCHVVLVDGISCLDAETQSGFPWIRSGALPATPGMLLHALFAPGISRRQREAFLEAEAFAQIARLQQAGLALTHIDTHKHLHQFPAILGPVLRAAARAGIRRIRNPFEPRWSRRLTPGVPIPRRIPFGLLQLFRRSFLRSVAEAGFATTSGAIGVLATGTLDRPLVQRLLAALPHGCWELVTHPGYSDEALAAIRTRLRAARQVELDALQAIPGVSGISLLPYGEPTSFR